MKLHIVLAFKAGLPLEDPFVTQSEDEAADVWWWLVEL